MVTIWNGYHPCSRRELQLAVQVLVGGALRCMFVFVPFVAFQAYGYYNICLQGFPDEMRPWCKARLPLLYNYIQSHYWGVGFLRYFQLKQVPNFLLAFPILSLSLYSIIHYVKLRPEVFFSLGFRASPVDKKFAAVFFSLGEDKRSKSVHFSEEDTSKICQDDQILRRRKQTLKGEDPVMLPLEPYNQILRQRKQTLKGEDPVMVPLDNDSLDKPGYLSVVVLPFLLHLGFMAATAFFVMHVQVATRFLSASPPLYWFASHLMVSPSIGNRWGHLIWGYCAAYILLGSLLFSNFYPFT